MGVVGASGYAGGELLRNLAAHPNMEVAIAAAGNQAGEQITDVHPGLNAFVDQVFAPTDPASLTNLDLVFVALPHGQSAALTAKLPESLRVVDLGADHRLRDSAAWDKYYGVGSMAPPWTYGLPELPGRRKAIAEANKVASPGCYATAMLLGLAPLLATELVRANDIVVVAASGTSGAGRQVSIGLLASEIMGSMSPYKVGGAHQHTAEVEQELSRVGAQQVQLSFTPLLAPMSRGIIATCTAKLAAGTDQQGARRALTDAYQDESFVRVLPIGCQPRTADTLGSNSAVLQVVVDEHANRVIVVSVLDNLGKGAAGQAIQNANIMFGFPETAGLSMNGVAP